MKDFQPGQILKHYQIVGKIGQGGMGQVYQAEDTKLGRHVAIKLLPGEIAPGEKARLRLLQEARSASSLNHPNIVTIHAIDDHDGLDFIVMEYVEGETLRAVIERGAIELTKVLDVGAQVADALAAAHAAGIIHRDIKSENILLTPRKQVKVLDFGLAKTISSAFGEADKEAQTRIDLTGAGVIIGTVHYMSPEQTRGESLDARSDIFSLGCVLYETATGRLPFVGPSLLSVAHDIAAAEPPSPSRIRPEIPVEFDMLIERALAKDRGQRYQTVSEMADALKSLGGISSERLTGLALALGTAPPEAEPELFVGRAREMKKLDDHLRRTTEGAGGVVLVTGEPGIGKSAFAGEFLRCARRQYPGILVARGRCVEQYGTGEAYLPFLDAVGALLTGAGRERIVALLRTYAPTWCLQFPAAFVSSVALEKLQQETAGTTRGRMLREMGDMLAALAAQTPFVLLLEDLHWADPSSVDLLRHLSPRVRDGRVLIVGTFRPEDVELNDHPLKTYRLEMGAHKLCEEIALGSLTRHHVSVCLNSRFKPNDFPPELAALIHGKTEGHPLFVLSLLQYLAEHGRIAKEGDCWTLACPLAELSLEAPENVRSMIRKKIDGLGGEDRRALQYASVEGDEFLSTTLAALLGTDDLELEERLAKLDRIHRLIQTRGEEELPDGTLATRYRFAHALYQNVLYGDLVSKRRVLLHRQAGEQLERRYGRQAPRIAAQLAMHFERGRDLTRAVRYIAHAGDNAARLYANAEAAKYYGRALDFVEKIPDDDERAANLLTLYQKRGRAHMALGRFEPAVNDFAAMLKEARAHGSPAQESAALNSLAMTLFYSHRLDEITARADEVLRAAERSGSDALRIEAMQVLALKHLGYGELAEAKPMLDEIIDKARGLGHQTVLLTGLAWRGILHFFQTEYLRAEDVLLEAQDLARELRDSFLLLESYFVLGMTRGNQGRMSESLATFHEGLEMAERYGDQFWAPRIPNCIGWVYRELHDFGRAIEYDRRGLDVGRRANVLEAQANSLINLGIDHGRAGAGEKTPSMFREVENIFQRDEWFRWRYQIRLLAGKCEHRLSRGDLDKAEGHARRLLESATHYEARKYIAVAHKFLAEIALARGDAATAVAEINDALDQLESHPVPIVAWKAYALLGRLRAPAGDADGAGEAFARAAINIEKIAGGVRVAELRDGFLNSPPVREVFAGAGKVCA